MVGFPTPANPLARLRKAMALSQVDRNAEALEELMALQQLAPRESTVYVQVFLCWHSLVVPCPLRLWSTCRPLTASLLCCL